MAWRNHVRSPRHKQRRCHCWRRASGPENPNWGGGRVVESKGYVLVWAPDHPRAMKMRGRGKYVYEHRLVVEGIVGRYLEPEEVVARINGDRTDNRPINLLLFPDKRAFAAWRAAVRGRPDELE